MLVTNISNMAKKQPKPVTQKEGYIGSKLLDELSYEILKPIADKYYAKIVKKNGYFEIITSMAKFNKILDEYKTTARLRGLRSFTPIIFSKSKM